MTRTRRIFEHEHDLYRESVRRFLAERVAPSFAAWDRDGIVPRELFAQAAEHGFLAPAVPVEHGGAGIDDFRFNAVLTEEGQRAGLGAVTTGLSVHSDICVPYLLELCDAEQRARWLPGLASGELIAAIAMTEPGTGSDLAAIATRAVRDGEHYVVDGSKTFITNGINADLVICVVRTDRESAHGGLSLLVVERGTEGFERGRNLDKLGLHAQDTAELSFSEVRVPAANLLGEEGGGFRYLTGNLPQERLAIAVAAVAAGEAALAWTLDYVRERQVFGRPIADLQHTRFTLAEIRTELDVAGTYVDECLMRHLDGALGAEDAAKAKWWTTELQGRIVDRCLQLHGGYGYMTEYPIAHAWADARVTRIYGGSTEIMKEIVARSIGLRG